MLQVTEAARTKQFIKAADGLMKRRGCRKQYKLAICARCQWLPGYLKSEERELLQQTDNWRV